MENAENHIKVHIFWDGHKILQNLHRRFEWHYIEKIYDGDFAKKMAFSQYMDFKIQHSERNSHVNINEIKYISRYIAK